MVEEELQPETLGDVEGEREREVETVTELVKVRADAEGEKVTELVRERAEAEGERVKKLRVDEGDTVIERVKEEVGEVDRDDTRETVGLGEEEREPNHVHLVTGTAAAYT